ncbi:hypothetical protein AMTRI_Chr10g226150 [Amborella trichopoda]|uniref:Uncharacterized protein n=1 Tax=Amborella trichopoda TaxID=13333 RepID=W1PIT7_AMBTC|nr:uncharacterized protein LOC18435774 [Amborella trichopoda]ERN07551.1 hypothetical protein AMTR_s00154p00066950 [Amborella trichopoda]|eukprot:XP_006845876.1 uncharacterized protein LOC18435774 [Amborella trichopoda]
MDALGFCSNKLLLSLPNRTKFSIKKIGKRTSAVESPLLIHSMATQNPNSATRPMSTKKGTVTVFPVGEPSTGPSERTSNSPPIKLLTRVEKLRLLTKAEKAGLLSAAEKFGLSLSTVEKLGLLSKAEEFGVLSAATDPATPSTLLSLSMGLLILGPFCVYFVPEDSIWEIALQVIVALVSILGGSAAFGASSFVSNLQKSG